ncbi:glycogen/starch/alpha-glucan phosphorylase [Parendozoicomonas haliclonae]|uniref:Alpha-1,4 glucan phosphorylase n=1 Tax=Parendozoicomonas haliclonae TaxID=1960125 RepID=A0A1X7AIW9_9GAMM|nr:glycogen/starch/alpha-glucan phosphorylase [Parendozoicomonas haliclonae]SMA44059.1 Maltodextrin phosphorylase [Parendozoicomonas haliclonae]
MSELKPTKISADQLSNNILKHLTRSLGITESEATAKDYWEALNLTVRDLGMDRIRATRQQERKAKARRVYYLSLEFLIGRTLGNNLQNMDIYSQAEDALRKFGVNLADVLEQEVDPALGNGGLGRLAACFMDSLATLDKPAIGYGINYRFGLFRQSFKHGQQIEKPDQWREDSNSWGKCRIKRKILIRLYGEVNNVDGKAVWENTENLAGIPWDMPVTGYESNTVNTLRLWESRAEEGFDLSNFDKGQYLSASKSEIKAESISQVLYPNDEHEKGKELRLIQQYFFVACSLADIIDRHNRENKDGWASFADKVAIQLNDTHPAIAIPELMRILMDEHDFIFEDALALCRKVFAYTNHTLLPEALERWPQSLINRVLPRHLQIIHMINHHFLTKEVENKWPGDNMMKRRLSIVQEPESHDQEPMIRMAFLSVIGSHKVNGVAALHSQLVKKNLFPGFNTLWPDKIVNVTNGVTPRRWLAYCNPKLAELIDSTIGTEWRKELSQLDQLHAYADDPAFQKAFADIKHENKEVLAKIIEEECGVKVSADALFDIQIKRLHEYKRQQLNLLHIMALYRRLLSNPELDVPQKVFIFGAKAAPGYKLAKTIIHAINMLGERINNDPRIKDKLKVVFLPNYRVSLAEKIIPAADVSEQISTAGFEASGTGNMKLALNGALTVGTLDGANVEIAEEVGEDNIFIFGLTVDEVAELRHKGYYPRDVYKANEELRSVIDWLASDDLCPEQPGSFQPLVKALLDQGDYFLTLADFAAYAEAHKKIDETWKNPALWWKKAIINCASMGKFSSDRSISDYCQDIWKM